MKNEYVIVLPNDKAKTYQYVTLFILLINCFVFGFIYFTAVDSKIKIMTLSATIISILPLIFFLINFFTKKIPVYRSEISFIIMAVCWFLLGKYLLALTIFCFAIIGLYSSKKFRVIFSTDKILYPSFPVKKYLWNEVSNAMLKDKVLTIDLKNNKLIQSVIEETEIDETEFNKFCEEQITAKAQRR